LCFFPARYHSVEEEIRMIIRTLAILGLALIGAANAQEGETWVKYPGGEGPGRGKHIVLISGDEEYRSEEALPQLGKILATHHGFDCTVLFAWNERTETIDPTWNRNIPGLAALDTADLMVIFTRFRDLPDEQMQHIEKFLLAGKPVIGIRTATHAFKPASGSAWEHWGDGYSGDRTEWEGGFGRLVLGEKWISHHGDHKHESTRGRIAPGAGSHPIARGIPDGAMWGPTDVYGVRLPLSGDSVPIFLGEVIKRAGDYNEDDLFYGMRPEDSAPVAAKNDPMMPIAWVKSYALPGGDRGRCFTSTIGASTDLVNEYVRRMFVNATYWLIGLDAQLPEDGARVDLVGNFQPSKYEFRTGQQWRARALKPAAFKD
jgi:hypothetical protein